MKTILVDAVNTLVIKDHGIFDEMYQLLEQYPNPKIVLTGADDEQFIKFGLDKISYEVFSLKHKPEKSDPEYYNKMLAKYNFKTDELVYFEHDKEAVKSAESVGIKTYLYDKDSKDLAALKKFLDQNLD